MRAVLPSRSLALLLSIGFIDLIVTAWLHANGQIVELNPLMRGFIERSEWLFVAVKGATLVAAWWVMASYAKTNAAFVRKVCLVGSFVYVAVWLSWFLATC